MSLKYFSYFYIIMESKEKKEDSVTKVGRPTLFKPEYCESAYKLCLLGAVDEDMADFFDVHVDTIYEWKNKYQEFSESVTRGKTIADAEVANSFFKKATGYDLPSEKVFQFDGTIIRADTITHYPPDAGAALNWLKNRQPTKWRDKHEVDHTTKGEKIDFRPQVIQSGPPLANNEKEVDL